VLNLEIYVYIYMNIHLYIHIYIHLYLYLFFDLFSIGEKNGYFLKFETHNLYSDINFLLVF
jgi:hypothetical protein